MSLILTGSEVMQVLDMDLALAAVEEAFRAYGEGRVNMPPKSYLLLAKGFLAPSLILAIIATGNWMRFVGHFDLEQTRIWASSLLTFAPIIPQNGMFLLHLALAQLLIVFIPFSKILHFGGIFFTQALIKRS